LTTPVDATAPVVSAFRRTISTAVGDSAVFYDRRLYTYGRKYRIVITTTPVVRPDEAQERANAVALAKGLIARLK
jgi:hypothetical protein